MDQVYELQTHEVEETHWWYAGRRAILSRAIDRIGMAPGIEILDAGCGSGRNMLDLSKRGTVTGIELADASVTAARARNVGEVVQGSVLELPFPDARFDFSVCLDVIEHLDDDRAALRELRRVIRPGGKLLVTVPAYQWLWSEHDVINHHRRRYNSTTLAVAARDAGWNVNSITYFNGLLLPVAVAFRGLSRLVKSGADPRSDLERTPTWVNSMLERPLLAESRWVGRGRRIPCGLSLLTILS